MVYGWAKKYGSVFVFDFIVHYCLCRIPQIGMKFTAFGIKLTFNNGKMLQNCYRVRTLSFLLKKKFPFFKSQG